MKFDYSDDSREDLLKVLEKWFDNGMLALTVDGIKLNTYIPHKSPWYYIRTDLGRRCKILKDIIAPAFKFVPSRCQECWKVVVRPRSLKELFRLVDIQLECEFFCKCGIEVRPYVFGNYGGYFYFNSVSEGLAGLDEVRRLVGVGISPDVPVILKRGCTELERMVPHSSKWTTSDAQKRIEDNVLSSIYVPTKVTGQSPRQIKRVMRGWVEFAYDRGDKTYLEHSNNRPLFSAPDMWERQNGCSEEIV